MFPGTKLKQKRRTWPSLHPRARRLFQIYPGVEISPRSGDVQAKHAADTRRPPILASGSLAISGLSMPSSRVSRGERTRAYWSAWNQLPKFTQPPLSLARARARVRTNLVVIEWPRTRFAPFLARGFSRSSLSLSLSLSLSASLSFSVFKSSGAVLIWLVFRASTVSMQQRARRSFSRFTRLSRVIYDALMRSCKFPCNRLYPVANNSGM